MSRSIRTIPANRLLASRSILHWLGFTKGYCVGHTYTGASSMSTILGDSESAYRYLNMFPDRYLQPNTFYREAGPVFETSMSVLASCTEMLLKSDRGTILTFPPPPRFSRPPARPSPASSPVHAAPPASDAVRCGWCHFAAVLHRAAIFCAYILSK